MATTIGIGVGVTFQRETPCPERADPDAPEFGVTWKNLWYADSLVLSDSDPVATWADDVAGASFAQVTESARPTFVAADANFGGRASVSFDGGDGMAVNPWSSPPSQPYTVVVVARIPHAASPTRQWVLYGNPPMVGKEDSAAAGDANKALQDHTTDGGGLPTRALPATAYVHIVVFDGPRSVSDTPNGTMPFTAGTDAPGSLLQMSPSFARLTGQVAYIGIADEALTAGQRGSLRTLLEAHYGI